MASTQTQLREHNQVTGATAQVSALRLLQAGAAPRTGLIAPARPRHSAPACAARVAPLGPPARQRSGVLAGKARLGPRSAVVPGRDFAASAITPPRQTEVTGSQRAVLAAPRLPVNDLPHPRACTPCTRALQSRLPSAGPEAPHLLQTVQTRTRPPRCPQARARRHCQPTGFAQQDRPPQPRPRGQPGAPRTSCVCRHLSRPASSAGSGAACSGRPACCAVAALPAHRPASHARPAGRCRHSRSSCRGV